MAELVDARDSKSRDREVMGVRFPLPAPSDSPNKSTQVLHSFKQVFYEVASRIAFWLLLTYVYKYG